MKIKDFNARLGELLDRDDIVELIEREAKRVVSHLSPISLEEAEDDYILPKYVLYTAFRNVAETYMPISRDKKDLNLLAELRRY